MESTLHACAAFVSQLLEAATLLLLTAGGALAFKNLIVGIVRGLKTDDVVLNVWQGFSRWLMVGLEFLVAADLVSTVVSPSWDELGRLATIAGIRTLLGFFLGRDLEAARRIARENAELAAAAQGRKTP
jgi:uncharacterized membrane protein